MKYLKPQYAAFHMRAVSLIWQLEKSTKSSHLESIVAQSISLSSSSLDIQSSCEAFGVLWRLTGTRITDLRGELNIDLQFYRGFVTSRLPITGSNDARLGHAEERGSQSSSCWRNMDEMQFKVISQVRHIFC